MPTPISQQAPQPADDAEDHTTAEVADVRGHEKAETPDLVRRFADDKLGSSDTWT
jgi:hypothetical protein